MENIMREVVHIFVGEFSYAMNWIAPSMHKQFQTLKDTKKIVISYAANEMLYRHFCDEFISLPLELTNKLTHPTTVGDTRYGGITPDFVIEYYKKIYPNADIVTPTYQIDAQEQMPYGIYNHISPVDKVKQEIDLFLEGFKKDHTITIMPKIRMKETQFKSGIFDLPNIQNWDIDNWTKIVNNLIDDGFNVVSFYIEDVYARGGSLSLPIKDSRFREFSIDLNSKYALDRQSWILKSTLCSIYGSTGAHCLPFWINTPVCAMIHSNYHHRSFFDWQKKLTNNHKNNKIINVEDFSKCKYDDIYGDIIHFINKN